MFILRVKFLCANNTTLCHKLMLGLEQFMPARAVLYPDYTGPPVMCC